MLEIATRLVEIGRKMIGVLIVAALLGILLKLALGIPFGFVIPTVMLIWTVTVYVDTFGPISSRFVRILGATAVLFVMTVVALQQTYPYRQKHHTLHEYDQTLHDEGVAGFFKK